MSMVEENNILHIYIIALDFLDGQIFWMVNISSCPQRLSDVIRVRSQVSHAMSTPVSTLSNRDHPSQVVRISMTIVNCK